MNPLQNNFNNMNNIKALLDTFQKAENPQQMLNDLINQNPQVKQIVELSKSTNGNFEQLFKNLCQQKGVDPNFILNQLR